LESHKTFEDRVAASDILINKHGLNVPMMYDTMADKFDKEFAVWPERYYIIKDNKIDRIFNPTTDFGFDRVEIMNELEKRLTWKGKANSVFTDLALNMGNPHG